MPRRDTDPPMRARVPADVERKDAILFGFTFRQLAILTVAGLLIYTAWTALATVVPPMEFLIGAIPLAGAAFVLAVGRRDGIPFDAWVWQAIRYRRAPNPTNTSTRASTGYRAPRATQPAEAPS